VSRGKRSGETLPTQYHGPFFVLDTHLLRKKNESASYQEALDAGRRICDRLRGCEGGLIVSSHAVQTAGERMKRGLRRLPQGTVLTEFRKLGKLRKVSQSALPTPPDFIAKIAKKKKVNDDQRLLELAHHSSHERILVTADVHIGRAFRHIKEIRVLDPEEFLQFLDERKESR